MSRTNGDSEAYIVCMSTKKENERGLTVIANGEKGANFLDLEIALEDGAMQENNILVTKKGNIKFPPRAFNTIVSSRKDRKTAKSTRNNKSQGLEK